MGLLYRFWTFSVTAKAPFCLRRVERRASPAGLREDAADLLVALVPRALLHVEPEHGLVEGSEVGRLANSTETTSERPRVSETLL